MVNCVRTALEGSPDAGEVGLDDGLSVGRCVGADVGEDVGVSCVIESYVMVWDVNDISAG